MSEVVSLSGELNVFRIIRFSVGIIMEDKLRRY